VPGVLLRRPPRLSPGDGAKPAAGKVLLFPQADYHLEEAVPLAGALRVRGLESVFLVDTRYWPAVRRRLEPLGFPIYRPPAPGTWLAGAAALVVFNDWGPATRPFVDAANDLEVPTFAKVEGAQDFGDRDVPRTRRPYRTARYVLCQGQNDVTALAGTDCCVVGSSRLERIHLGPVSTAPPEPTAVVNVNFTYGVLEDARRPWVGSVLDACATADYRPLVSLHPAERQRRQYARFVSRVPMRRLLESATVLISRFSTVPFEAMARGVPFIYHNPHGEGVPTFRDPDGAFPVTETGLQLTEALTHLDPDDDWRARTRSFFLRQVDIDESTPSEERSAAHIESVLER